MTLLNKKLKAFFATHPESTVVYVALGVLFIEIDKANAYCGGVAGHSPVTYTREQVEAMQEEAAAAPVAEETQTGTSVTEENNNDTPPADPIDETPAVEETPDGTAAVEENNNGTPAAEAPVADTTVAEETKSDAPAAGEKKKEEEAPKTGRRR